MAVEEVSKTLHLPAPSVQALVDFLVEEKVLGIEYKFTTPYIYINNSAGIVSAPLPPLESLGQPHLDQGGQKKDADQTTPAEILMLVAGIKSLLENKQFDQVEDAYDSLWKKVANGNYAWDKGLHEELLAINDQIGKVIGGLYGEFTKKSQLIRQMAAQAQSYLLAKQPEEALKIYNELSAHLESLPTLLYQEKKALEREILRLYRDIHEAQGALASQKAAMLSRTMSEQIGRLRPYLLSGNIPLAMDHYSRLLSLYAQLPSGFLPLKASMGREMTQMYKLLAIQVEIEMLKRQLHPLTQRRISPSDREGAIGTQNLQKKST